MVSLGLTATKQCNPTPDLDFSSLSGYQHYFALDLAAAEMAD